MNVPVCTVANCHGREPSECRKQGCTDDRKGQFRVGSKLIMIKTEEAGEAGHHLCHTLLSARPAAPTVPFPLLQLSHAGSYMLCRRANRGPANVCFLFLNSVASSRFKRGARFTTQFIPSEIAVWQCPLLNRYLPYVTYLQLDPEEGRQGGVALWQGCFHHKFRSHAPSFQCCVEKGTRLCPPRRLLCTEDQWKLCPETAKTKSRNNCSYQNGV